LALAEKPDWKEDNGYQQKRESNESRREDLRERDGARRDYDGRRQREEVRLGGYFRDDHRVVIRDYYGREYGAGRRCPPGLAKKNTGCLPPGQAKKWAVGHVLPRDVIYYAVPPAVLVQLGPAPYGHRFVRVAADILLIAIGTGMVIDAIEDLGR
jgi:hypothetical protein